jgi:hypothetical protein
MKIIITTLLITISCLSANAQFFSKEETESKKEVLKKSIPKSEQKEVYILICEARENAKQKAIHLHKVKIHQTPEQREAKKEKVKNTQRDLFKHYKADITENRKLTDECIAEIERTGKANHWPKTHKKPEPE